MVFRDTLRYLSSQLLLRLGEHDVRSSGGPSSPEPHPHTDRKVAAVLPHPGYDRATFENDLALLKMDRPVVFRPNIVPVCLPEVEDPAGTKAWVTGFGRLYRGRRYTM